MAGRSALCGRGRRAGSDYRGTRHAHDSQGLPGEGNILLFDNGGTMPGDLYADSQAHAWSRIIEFNPVDKTRVWEYSAATMKVSPGQHGYKFFFSPYISIAQRLPNATR